MSHKSEPVSEPDTTSEPIPKPVPVTAKSFLQEKKESGWVTFWSEWGFLFAHLFLLLLMMIAYWPLTGIGLLSDDWGLASSQAAPAPWLSLHGHWFGGGEGYFYRPVPRIALFYQGQIFGDSGFAQNLINLILHGSIATFLFLAVARFSRCAAIIASAIFLFHPSNIEAVGWVSSQTDLWFLFFFSGAVFMGIRFTNLIGLIGAGAFAVLACMSKETAIFLGPIFVAIPLFLYLFPGLIDSEWKKKTGRYLLLTAAVHLAIWVIYMLLRKLFLGTFLPQYTEEVLLPQMSVNVLGLFDGLMGPLFPDWFSGRASLEASDRFFLIPVISVPLLLFWSIWKKDGILSGAVLLFGMTMGAFIPALVTSINMDGNDRYYYFPLFAVSIVLGIILSRPFQDEKLKPLQAPLVLLGVLILVRFNAAAWPAMEEFIQAGEVRDEMGENLDQAHENHERINIALEEMPDRIGGAYIFRNGFSEFMLSRYGYTPDMIDYSDEIDFANFNGERPVFTINFNGHNNGPIVTEDTIIATALARRNDSGSAVPITIDFRTRADLAGRLPISNDLKIISHDPENGLVLNVTGDDPNIAIPFPAVSFPAQFKRIKVEMTLVLQEEHELGENDVCELVFLNAAEGSAPVTLIQPLPDQQGWKTYEFNMENIYGWQVAESLRWIRFDPSTQYRGYVILRQITLE